MTKEQVAELERLIKAKKLADRLEYKKKYEKAKRDAKKQDQP
jgi:hypothetical protein